MTTIPIGDQNIITLLGLESLPDEQKLAMVEKVSELVQKRLLVKIFESLDSLRQSEFSELLEKDDQTALQDFLQRQVPSLPELLESEVMSVKQELGEWAENLT